MPQSSLNITDALYVPKRMHKPASQLLLERISISNFLVQDSFRYPMYGAQDSFSSKIRPVILMVSLNSISKSLRCSLNLPLLVNEML